MAVRYTFNHIHTSLRSHLNSREDSFPFLGEYESPIYLPTPAGRRIWEVGESLS